jgi:serine/threonine protein kinase/Tfp pilus assembly protein PilF
MGIRCPECKHENPDDTLYCGKCASPLTHPADISVTKTLAPVEQLAPGSTFANRYEIIEELGKGGMGKVYKVHDAEIKEAVALKLLKPEIASDEKTVERFRNELKIARRISHKNVCRMYDIGREDEKYFITMEYVAGEDLKSLIRRKGKLSTEEAVGIAQQVCEGLAAAHELGVVHRDLKPQNIMIDEKGRAKIMDFGIARSVEAPGVTQTGAIIGTPDYISPEQAEGEKADQRSDIYSLGVVLYEMVTGGVPFKGDTAFGVALKHKTQLPQDPRKFNSQLSDDLSRLILVCMEKDRERRYQTAEELRADLRNIEEGFPLGTKIRPKRKTFAATLVREKLFIPALVVALAVIAIVVWKFFPKKEAPIVPRIENSIAVISFENLTGDPQYNDLVKAVPNLLITKFESMGFSYVVTWERQQDILKQMGKDPGTAVDTSLGFEICRRDGIAALAVGRITKAGDIFATDLKILDAETKRSLISTTSSGDGAGSILKFQIDELALSTAQGLGWNLQEAKKAPPISEVTTSSTEAYQHYLSGVSAMRKFYYEEARQHLLKAVEVDSSFASAYLELAKTYSNLLLKKERNEAIEKAISLVDKANPKEKLYIQAFHASYVENNYDKFIQMFKQMVEKYPKEKKAHYYLGMYYYFRQLWDESLREFHTSVELDPYYAIVLNMIALTYQKIGKYDKGLEYAKRYVDAAPNEANPLNTLGFLYLWMGQFDLAIEQFKKALNIKPDFDSSLLAIGYTYALKEDYDDAIKWAEEYRVRAVPSFKYRGYILKAFYEYWTGSYKKALDGLEELWIDDNLDKKEKIGSDLSSMYAYYNMKSLVSLAQGNFKRYREEMRRSEDALAGSDPENTKFTLDTFSELSFAYSECLEGKTNAARDRLTRVESLLPQLQDYPQHVGETINRMLEYLKAKILLAEGSWDEAISILEQLSPAFVVDYFNSERIVEGNTLFYHEMDLAYVYEMKGEIDKAVSALEDIVRFNSADKDLRLTPPNVYYNLGRLYEKKSMKEKARENYERFLKLWKDADPGLAEVEDARKSLAGLQVP